MPGTNMKIAFVLVIALITSVLIFINSSKGNEKTLTVSGLSMFPALSHGEKVKISNVKIKKILNNDLVAIKFKTRDKMMVKRVVAIPGDKVSFSENSTLSVNGAKINENLNRSALLKIQLKSYRNIVPKNNYLVMGDNMKNSYDSGDYGFISKSKIVGFIN
jgi:signal peptidase I